MRDASTDHPHLAVETVILAAGSASRIGHRPKCLLQLNGEPLIQRLLCAVFDAGIKDVTVVLGHYAEQIKPIVTKLPVTLVHNPAPDCGQNSSLHCGLRALPPTFDAVMVMLADQPLIETRDIDDLLCAYQHRPMSADVVVPITNNLPGNPVIFSRAVSEAILNSDEAYGCKQWQLENNERVYRWATTNEHYRLDIDTLDDLDTFQARTGLSLHWPLSF